MSQKLEAEETRDPQQMRALRASRLIRSLQGVAGFTSFSFQTSVGDFVLSLRQSNYDNSTVLSGQICDPEETDVFVVKTFIGANGEPDGFYHFHSEHWTDEKGLEINPTDLYVDCAEANLLITKIAESLHAQN